MMVTIAESVVERTCSNERVRTNVFERTCSNERVRTNVFERTCSNERVRTNVFERTCSNERTNTACGGFLRTIGSSEGIGEETMQTKCSLFKI